MRCMTFIAWILHVSELSYAFLSSPVIFRRHLVRSISASLCSRCLFLALSLQIFFSCLLAVLWGVIWMMLRFSAAWDGLLCF